MNTANVQIGDWLGVQSPATETEPRGDGPRLRSLGGCFCSEAPVSRFGEGQGAVGREAQGRLNIHLHSSKGILHLSDQSSDSFCPARLYGV